LLPALVCIRISWLTDNTVSRKKSKVDKNQGGSGAKHPQSQKETTNRQVFVEPGVKIDFVDDLREEHKTRHGENTAHQKSQLRWTKIAAGLVFIYTVVMGWQAILTHQSLKATREFFQLDQRPYVFSTKVNPAQFAPPNNRLGTQLYYFNYGKSPALHMKKVGWIFVGDDALKQVDDWFKRLGNGPLEKAKLEESTDSGGSQRPFLSETILMQGEKPVLTTVVSRTSAPSPDVQYVVAMRFQYLDTFGNRYWSDVCFWHPPGDNGEIGNRCIAHNEIH
jgi:hypothetical protein